MLKLIPVLKGIYEAKFDCGSDFKYFAIKLTKLNFATLRHSDFIDGKARYAIVNSSTDADKGLDWFNLYFFS